MIRAFAAQKPGAKLELFEYEPGPLEADELEIAVETCGICHSDLSMLDNEWGFTAYPFVPGHEIIGKVARFIKELDVDQVMFSITSPFPGTEFYDLAKQNGWFANGDYHPVDVQKEAITSFPRLSKYELEREVLRANRRFFLSPRFIRKNLHRFKTYKDFKAASVALYRKLWA